MIRTELEFPNTWWWDCTYITPAWTASTTNFIYSWSNRNGSNWNFHISNWELSCSSTIIWNINGNSNTATTLATWRSIQTNLASTSSASFNGSADITPWVTGTLPTWNGWTGRTDWRIANVLNHRDSGELSFWTGTQAQYNAIWTKDNARIYIITDA